MSRYADLWPVVPNWVEAIATDGDGTVVGFMEEELHRCAKSDIWFPQGGDFIVLERRAPTPGWRDSLERRPRPANPTLCPHCGKEI